VMNTDNTSVSGETLDYGPCAFLDEYDPKRAFSSIDRTGRYAFAAQPRIMLWNLARLGETLLPLIHSDVDAAVPIATQALERYSAQFERAYLDVMRAKLGLTREEIHDASLIENLLSVLADQHIDFTLFFRRLCTAADPASGSELTTLFRGDPGPIHAWLEAWRARLALEPAPLEGRINSMRRSNPAFIPRNHRVEEAIGAAQLGDFGPFETLAQVLERPYDEQPEHAHLAEPPGPEQREYVTFCGT
jgi:uncharacterized protein YdiU (UPF0061 family)